MQIQMDRLLRTSLYRALLKSLTRKAVSGKQITKLLSRFRTTGYDHLRRYGCSIGIENFELYAGSIPLPSSTGFRTDTPPPHYLSRFINQAIEFICTETDLLYYRLEHPQCFISEPAPQSPLHWSKKYHAVDLSESLQFWPDESRTYYLVRTGSQKLRFYLVIQHFEQFLNIKLGNPGDIKRRVLERKKDRTKFTEAIFHTLNNEDE